MEELGNPFEEDSPDLVALDTKEIVGSPAIEVVRSCQTKDGNLDDFFRHENHACPPALSDGWSLHLGTKSDLLTCFEEIADARSEAPTTTTTIVQMLKPAVCKNFREYEQQIFIPYMSTKFQCSSRLDLVWDTYRTDSLKASARAKRGKGVRKCVVVEGAISRNWQNFLRVDTNNKTQLFKFLSEALLLWFNLKDMQLVVTDGEEVCSKPPLSELSSLAPCTHKEAGSRMLLHISHAAGSMATAKS
ncbi:hypothetical protein GQR58_005902 [Nymphon striatum]|nr:hypothetical protein GQR58_005902 [Nymphon striatum]